MMAVFRLDPIDTKHPSWSRSDAKYAVWAGADTPAQARNLVAAKTIKAIVAGQTRPPISTSPWLDDAITSCVQESDRHAVAAGTVVDADGRTIPLG